jgi:hypothetical protein
MRLHGIDIGAVQERLIRVLVIGCDFLHQFELTHFLLGSNVLTILLILQEND